MAKTHNLTDLQRTLWLAAAGREDASLYPVPADVGTNPAGIAKSIAALVRRSFAVEIEGEPGDRCWRSNGDRHYSVMISQSGRDSLVFGEPEARIGADPAPLPVGDPEPRVSGVSTNETD